MRISQSLDTALMRRAALAAGIMMAWQVAAKTLRDSLFLNVYEPRALPAMVGAASVCAVLLAALSSRVLRRLGPFRVIPRLYLVSTALHGLEYVLLPQFRGPVAVVVYLHVVAFGSVLLSGFWALANERFDPRDARRQFGRIAGFGTLGGLAGGLMAERVSTLISLDALLPLLLVLQLAVGIVLMGISAPKTKSRPAETPPLAQTLAHAPYLFGLAALILLVSMSAAALDFLFKSAAVVHFGRGPSLSRYFALFYVSSSVLSFAAQTGGSRYWLERFGLGRTVATLPTGVAAASLLTLISPGAYLLTLARGLELVLRGSLFRSGYELFYTPMPQEEKRSAKSMIDIGADRLGDGLGAAAIGLLIWLPPGDAKYAILLFTAALSGVAAWLSIRLDRAYSQVLEKKLAEHAVELKSVQVEDPMMQSVLMRSMTSMVMHPVPTPPGGVPKPAPAVTDPIAQLLAELRSPDPHRVRMALQQMGPLDPLLAPQVILLLGRDSVHRAVHAALSKSPVRIDGQLVDSLLDQAQDFTVRRRIPRLLSVCDSRRAWNGLFDGLEDPTFEIRSRCAKALDAILLRNPRYRPDPAVVFDIVGKELLVSPAPRPRDASVSGEDQTSRSLTHILTLLGLVLPREAVQTALRALLTEDLRLRSLALEYLESAVPRELREPLCARLEARPVTVSGVLPEQSLAKLMNESPSILAKLEEIGQRTGQKPRPPEEP